ncbi:MAG: aldose 1-epimerase family protein [Panacibacter sp.]
MQYTIENKLVKATIASKGAELQSLTHKNFSMEYMWNGDPSFWSKRSPVLFPIVGGLKNNSYTYNGQLYNMGRHGFARDMEFEVSWQKEDGIMFTLVSNEETMAMYPFHFSFSVKYTLDVNDVNVSYIVQNTGKENMFFSVGGHPAFKLPITEGTSYDDYYLQFSRSEALDRWPLSADGLIINSPKSLVKISDKLPLLKELFYDDALVFKNLMSKYVFIRSDKSTHGIKVHISGFPYLGIWSAKNADFVCIEPWCGIADIVDSSGKLEEKEGINQLKAGETFESTWSVEVY